ncbi:MAG: hypothetical protein P8Y64_12730 [Gammaproteobacteria bacterium]
MSPADPEEFDPNATRIYVPPTGKTLEDGVSGNYDFNIGDVLAEGWRRTKGMKGSFWAAGALFFLVMIAVTLLLTGAMAVLGVPQEGLLGQFIVQLVMTVVVYPFMAGFLMMGIRRSVDLPISMDTAFGYFGFAVPVIVAAILMSVLTTVGFMLLVLPGIYLSIAYMLAVPLIVEKGLGPWRAMESSRRAITKHWFKVFFLMIAMSIILLISMIPFGLGLIWTYPMMVTVMGVLYREVFGVEDALMAQALA